MDDSLKNKLTNSPKRWLITGVGGFIGSNLLESLLKLNQKVVGLDNFSTGKKENLEKVRAAEPKSFKDNFSLIECDIRDIEGCKKACSNINFVLHHAALGSVPRSVKDPLETNQVNIGGTLNIMLAAKDAGVERFIYASSSSVYGDNQDLPKTEGKVGKPLSPYALTKSVNELYAVVFADLYGFSSVGLRYFNVFGPRQDPAGEYAAVIPRWIANLLKGEQCLIFGDGTISRDFCYIENVVQANLLAALSDLKRTGPACILNIGTEAKTSLSRLYEIISSIVTAKKGREDPPPPRHDPPRAGDIQHSLADISRALEVLGYKPSIGIEEGLTRTVQYFMEGQR